MKKLDSVKAYLAAKDRLEATEIICRNSHQDGEFNADFLEISWSGWLDVPSDSYPKVEALISKFATELKALREEPDRQLAQTFVGQLGDLIGMANKAGMYDAAAYLLMKLCDEEKDIFEQCNDQWKRQVYDWRRRASKAIHDPERYPALQWIKGFIDSATAVLGPYPVFGEKKDAEADQD